jgi:hypothetical protein
MFSVEILFLSLIAVSVAATLPVIGILWYKAFGLLRETLPDNAVMLDDGLVEYYSAKYPQAKVAKAGGVSPQKEAVQEWRKYEMFHADELSEGIYVDNKPVLELCFEGVT